MIGVRGPSPITLSDHPSSRTDRPTREASGALDPSQPRRGPEPSDPSLSVGVVASPAPKPRSFRAPRLGRPRPLTPCEWRDLELESQQGQPLLFADPLFVRYSEDPATGPASGWAGRASEAPGPGPDLGPSAPPTRTPSGSPSPRPRGRPPGPSRSTRRRRRPRRAPRRPTRTAATSAAVRRPTPVARPCPRARPGPAPRPGPARAPRRRRRHCRRAGPGAGRAPSGPCRGVRAPSTPAALGAATLASWTGLGTHPPPGKFLRRRGGAGRGAFAAEATGPSPAVRRRPTHVLRRRPSPQIERPLLGSGGARRRGGAGGGDPGPTPARPRAPDAVLSQPVRGTARRRPSRAAPDVPAPAQRRHRRATLAPGGPARAGRRGGSSSALSKGRRGCDCEKEGSRRSVETQSQPPTSFSPVLLPIEPGVEPEEQSLSRHDVGSVVIQSGAGRAVPAPEVGLAVGQPDMRRDAPWKVLSLGARSLPPRPGAGGDDTDPGTTRRPAPVPESRFASSPPSGPPGPRTPPSAREPRKGLPRALRVPRPLTGRTAEKVGRNTIRLQDRRDTEGRPPVLRGTLLRKGEEG